MKTFGLPYRGAIKDAFGLGNDIPSTFYPCPRNIAYSRFAKIIWEIFLF